MECIGRANHDIDLKVLLDEWYNQPEQCQEKRTQHSFTSQQVTVTITLAHQARFDSGLVKFDLRMEDSSGTWHSVRLIDRASTAATTGHNLTLYACLRVSQIILRDFSENGK